MFHTLPRAKKRLFLSTPSARRATNASRRKAHDANDFYPRPPRGGRPILPTIKGMFPSFLSTPSARRATGNVCGGDFLGVISIHALREEGDCFSGKALTHGIKFLSTPSARRATSLMVTMPFLMRFLSTPSARRATCRSRYCRPQQRYFYPRPPRGGRRISVSARVLS